MEHNKTDFTGKIKCLQQITPKLGKPMSMLFLFVEQDNFRIVVLGNLVAVINAAKEGILIGVIGTTSISSVQTDYNTWCKASAENWSGP